MYSVVQFVCDDSVAVVANSWLLGDNLVAWPKDRELQRLLEANRRPTDGAKLYEVKVLKDGLDLDKARRIAQKAENTDHLSSSEPERLGRGMRTKFPRRLTSDSEEDDEIQEIRSHTDRRLCPWPEPPAVLRPINDNVPSTSYSQRTEGERTSYQLPDGENLPPEIRNLLKKMEQEWACVRRKLDFLSEEMVWVKTHIRDIEAKQADNRRALQAVSFVSKVKPPILQLPLRTAEAYKDFLAKIGSDNELAQETVKHLSTVGGRTEKEFVRNLLTALLGPPLCQTFCWAGSNDKKSFVGSPLFSVLSDAIRCNEQYRSCHSEIIRQTAIEWFHGTRDRYGGRAKRRRVADMGSLEQSTSTFELSQTISEDTEPAVDEKFRQHNDAV